MGRTGRAPVLPREKPGAVLCCPRLGEASFGGSRCPSPSPSLPLIAQEVSAGEREWGGRAPEALRWLLKQAWWWHLRLLGPLWRGAVIFWTGGRGPSVAQDLSRRALLWRWEARREELRASVQWAVPFLRLSLASPAGRAGSVLTCGLGGLGWGARPSLPGPVSVEGGC